MNLIPISKCDLAELCAQTGFLPNTVTKALSSPETTRKSTRTVVLEARKRQLESRSAKPTPGMP